MCKFCAKIIYRKFGNGIIKPNFWADILICNTLLVQIKNKLLLRIMSYFMNTSNDYVPCHFQGFRYRRFPQLVTVILVGSRHFISPAVKCCYCLYRLLTAIYCFVQTDGLIEFFFLIKPSAYVFHVDMFSLFPCFLSSCPYIILNGFQVFMEDIEA